MQPLRQWIRQWIRRTFSVSTRHRIRRVIRPAFMGTLRRTTPISPIWGFDRGNAVDRFYIERFLAQHRSDITGRVLEVQSPAYTQRFGTAVTRSDVLDIAAANPLATLVADLAAADALPSDAMDCFVLTQTLHLIHDLRGALHHAHRMLKPGGVLLATIPAVSRIDPDSKADQWRMTPASAERLFTEVFGPGQVSVQGHGNVLTCIAFLAGMAAQELSTRELNHVDDAFPMLITIRAVKADPERKPVDISVVIPTYNRSHALAKCITSLCAQDLDAHRHEIVVVVDGSTDGTGAMLKGLNTACRLTVVEQPENLGQATSMNAGVRAATGRIVLFIDDDMHCPPTLLSAHLAAHAQRSDASVVFGPILASGPGEDFSSSQLAASFDVKFSRLMNDPTPIWPGDAVLMPNTSLSRELFASVGGFDTANFARRRFDEELGLRLWRSAVRFVFAPDAQTSHAWQKGAVQMRHDWIEGGAALVRLHRKHPELIGVRPTFGKLLAAPPWKRRMSAAASNFPRLTGWSIDALMLAARLVASSDKAARREQQLQSAKVALFALHGALREAGRWSEFARLFKPDTHTPRSLQ
ncbi:glycosyltransferase [Caenimonas sp. SL110]|uniref:glycosyltransferase n=1 Tax=Caenimonas sp. SL110 TaxID=1450524 RepID=UPI0009E53E7D|nr:glycosyltransferase [Caenimonas sp. SL110]